MSPHKRRAEPGKFTRREFERRAERACKVMTREKLDGLLVTSESNVEYLYGEFRRRHNQHPIVDARFGAKPEF